jgi:N-acylneuraminate cytidylyltransferase
MTINTNNPLACAVIVGRAGSKGLPRKNELELAGEPMVAYSIEDARSAQTVRRIIVSTDSEVMAQAAQQRGVELVARPRELADDTATVDAAVRHAVRTASINEPVIVILYANVPIRPEDLIDRAVRELVTSGADSVQSYADVGKHHPHWMVRLGAGGRVEPHVNNAVYRRQDLPELLLPDGGVIAVTRAALLAGGEQPHSFLGEDRRGIRAPAGTVLDIDSAVDLAIAEAYLDRTVVGATA